MAEKTNDMIPAYLSVTTFKAAVQNLRAHGLPEQLDKSAWASRSGTEQGQIWGAFRFLGLINGAGETQPILKSLVEIQDNSKEEKARIGEILKGSYTKVFNLDLTTATPKQLEDAIGEYGTTGATKKRAVRFFIKSAHYAGIPLSSRLTANLRDRTSGEESAEENTEGEPVKSNGKPRKRKRTQPGTTTSRNADQGNQSNAMKTIQLPKVSGTLSVSGTFNPFLLVGEERDLVYQIIDLMTAYEQKA